MATLVDIYANCGSQDVPYGSSGADWVKIDLVNDYLIFSGGSDAVADGEVIPSSADLNQAAVLLVGSETVVPKYFLADVSEGIIREIHLAGNIDAQYVFAFVFDGATATEPVLELWDDAGLNSIAIETLGAGTPANSWYKGICTTESSSGSSWVGAALAGSSSSHFISLNAGNGALLTSGVCYAQLKIVIPATASTAGLAAPVFVCKYADN